MGIGTSIVVFAVGAVLRFAVSVSTSGFNIHTIGVILMIVGAVGLLVSMVFWGSRRSGGSWAVMSRSRRRTVAGGAAGPAGPVVAEEERIY